MLATLKTVYNLSFHLMLGLIVLIVVNLVLDSLDAVLNKTFEWNELLKNSIKGVIVLACFLATYFAGYINQDLVGISIFEEQNLNLKDAATLMATTVYFFYAKSAIEKIYIFITNKSNKNT